MKEIRQPLRAQIAGPGGLGNPFDQDEPDRATILVAHGPFHEPLPVVGMTVGEIRARFRDVLGLQPGLGAILDGRNVGDEVVVRAAQVLAFINPVGEKGRFG